MPCVTGIGAKRWVKVWQSRIGAYTSVTPYFQIDATQRSVDHPLSIPGNDG
jgi:hypothetical protein